ncbi:MAG: hypothetical protein NC548_06005 [Lachnospiraceae bacterium]|nr:hypothetical protein [Lachnospiraceae bacterium]
MNQVPAKLANYTINRMYYKSAKYSFNMFIPPLETIYGDMKYTVNPNVILYLTLPWPKDPEANKSGRSFAIRVWNQRKILRLIGQALDWFTAIEDLYMINEGTLYFNMKYKDLCVKYAPKPFEPPQAFKITPIALEYGNGKYQEGVRFHINTIENFMELTREELEELFDILAQFNFGVEAMVCYQALLMSFLNKGMTSADDHRRKITNGFT